MDDTGTVKWNGQPVGNSVTVTQGTLHNKVKKRNLSEKVCATRI